MEMQFIQEYVLENINKYEGNIDALLQDYTCINYGFAGDNVPKK